jgi:RNA polymerase sigma-70 factor (ECF subfamily)
MLRSSEPREPVSPQRASATVISLQASHDGAVIAESLAMPAAFGAIFDRHFDVIHGYLQRQVGPDRADDLASQTFLVAFDKRAKFDVSRSLARPWLFGIATNLLRRHYRDVKRQLHAYAKSGVDPILDAFEGAEERLDAQSMRPRLAGVLGDLPREEMETLLLYAWGELTYIEVAETLEIPVGTVRSRLNRARGRVRELEPDQRPIRDAGAPAAQAEATR